jgi:alpha-D-ribose 1-methylphosphonate 5-triphosphate synthase subunit PhnH
MIAMDFSQVGAGFSDLALGSQAVFRTALEAISRPGSLQTVECDADMPAGVDPAACALLLALLDQDTKLWLSPTIAATPSAAYLRLHTGCTLVDAPQACDFAWVGAVHELPALNAFAQGTDEYPDQSATCVIQVAGLEDGFGWTLAGPGILGSAKIAVPDLNGDFTEQWSENHAAFPCGVDVFLTSGKRLLGLPRTTRIEA